MGAAAKRGRGLRERCRSPLYVYAVPRRGRQLVTLLSFLPSSSISILIRVPIERSSSLRFSISLFSAFFSNPGGASFVLVSFQYFVQRRPCGLAADAPEGSVAFLRIIAAAGRVSRSVPSPALAV